MVIGVEEATDELEEVVLIVEFVCVELVIEVLPVETIPGLQLAFS